MTSAVLIDDYCANPSKYKDILPEHTMKYYDQYCDARQSVADQNQGTSIEDLGKAVPKALLEMLQSVLTPESMGMLAGVMGINLVSKALFKKLVQSIAQRFSEEMADAMAGMAADGLSSAAINASAMLSTMLDNAILENVGDVGVYAVGVLLKGAESLADMIPVIGEIMMMLQLIGMIFDAWDPCHLNNELNATAILKFNNSFDNMFRSNMLVSVNSFTDLYGNTYFYDLWPVDFFADYGVLANAKKDKYAPLRAVYMAKWLNSRDVNSNGQPIYWPPGGKVVDQGVLDKLERHVALAMADNNTVVASWIVRYIPVILILIAILIFIIFVLIK